MSARGLFGAMAARRPGALTLALALWLVLEFAAFWIVVDRVGLLGACLIGLAATLAGIAILRHAGRGAIDGLRRAANGDAPREGALLDGVLAATGGVLLILPGFVSDLVGLALAAPSLRGWIARRFAPTQVAARPAPPGVIDLDPQDWRAGADPAAPRIGRESR
jgi:UPF0716 protein FxsA